MRDLSGRRALFVGGSSGMGLAAARLFHDLGAEVILAGRSIARLEAARRALQDTGVPEVLAFDITDAGQVDQALSRLPAGGIDHLVISAANITHGPFGDQPVAEVRAMFDSKFWGAYGLARAALPYLREGGVDCFLLGCPQSPTRCQLRRAGGCLCCHRGLGARARA